MEDHNTRYFGRDKLARTCIDRLLERFDDGSRVAVLRLTGSSGSGKSSLLRAGILGGLTAPEHRGRYYVAAVRPEDLHDAGGREGSVIPSILNAIVKKAGLDISGADILDITDKGSGAPKRAAEIISRELRRRPNRDARLVLGLDQFEEIVDILAGREPGDWHILLQFVEEAIRHPNIGFVYTLESSRKHQHDQLELGNAFKFAHEEELDLDRDFIDEIIRKPFADTGYALANDVVDTLKRNLHELQDEKDHLAYHSVLPLLAVRLYFLWEFVSKRFEPGTSEGNIPFDLSPNLHNTITVAQLQETDRTVLEFKDIIQQQAELAWKKAGIGSIQDEQLEFFLQPLVGVENGRLKLIVGSRLAPYRNERALLRSFMRHGLIVGAGDGTVRFVHEAVLMHWKEAKEWFDQRQEFLEMKARLRSRALAWDSDRRPKIRRTRDTEKEIAEAVEVLWRYIRHWSIEQVDPLYQQDPLYEYCLTIFSLSRTPRALSLSFPKIAYNHATLAATYGLVPLLKRYARLDAQSLLLVNEYGQKKTPLIQAAWGQLEAVQFLLDHGADPFLPDKNGWLPCHAPIQMHRQDIFTALMDAAAGKSAKGHLEKRLLCPDNQTFLHIAAEYDNYDAAHDLIHRYGFSPSSKSAL
ncbi:MAG TPA: ankyrin repeat domain-containing protein, partial [Puia sp.]|nr:ankyrin repeat domain-containing protein [Puia sp.]